MSMHVRLRMRIDTSIWSPTLSVLQGRDHVTAYKQYTIETFVKVGALCTFSLYALCLRYISSLGLTIIIAIIMLD